MADGKDDVDQWKELNEARKASIQRKLMVPLIYAPMLPLIRIGFNHNPTLREQAIRGIADCRARPCWVHHGERQQRAVSD